MKPKQKVRFSFIVLSEWEERESGRKKADAPTHGTHRLNAQIVTTESEHPKFAVGSPVVIRANVQDWPEGLPVVNAGYGIVAESTKRPAVGAPTHKPSFVLGLDPGRHGQALKLLRVIPGEPPVKRTPAPRVKKSEEKTESEVKTFGWAPARRR